MIRPAARQQNPERFPRRLLGGEVSLKPDTYAEVKPKLLVALVRLTDIHQGQHHEDEGLEVMIRIWKIAQIEPAIT